VAHLAASSLAYRVGDEVLDGSGIARLHDGFDDDPADRFASLGRQRVQRGEEVMSDLHNLALKAGAAYWQEPGAKKPTYLMSIDELEGFLLLFLAEHGAFAVPPEKLQ
jgi:hypothetical protein